MATAYQRQCLGALKLAEKIIGPTDFTLSKIPGQFHGVFNQLSQEREFMEEGSGRKITYHAILICPMDQFRSLPTMGMVATITTKAGTALAMTRKLRVVKVEEDSISFTLQLGNVNN